jgi:hypothetical protein
MRKITPLTLEYRNIVLKVRWIIRILSGANGAALGFDLV